MPELLLKPKVSLKESALSARTKEEVSEVVKLAKTRKKLKLLVSGESEEENTLTAKVLASELDFKLYRIDLSMIVSKYIGETEKNLEKIFDKAANKDWVLFFDEADALFGKHTEVSDAHDRYANQETSYLLEMIANFEGIMILATNSDNTLDPAFVRKMRTIKATMASPSKKKSFLKKDMKKFQRRI